MRLLDLFCGQGGASVGYARAGWDVTGVDIAPQSRYPFPFVQADAMDVLADGAFMGGFDAVHASPPARRTALSTPTTVGFTRIWLPQCGASCGSRASHG